MVDPEAAEVVKRIFAMTIEGYGPYQIASKLKEEKVLIPSAYLAQHGEGVNKNKTFKDVLPQQSREFPSQKSCSAKSMRTTF